VTHSKFALPEELSKSLAGDTPEMSFSDATWGIRFPEVDDLATLPKGARFLGLDKAPKNLKQLRHADQLVAIKILSTTPEIVNELPYLHQLRMAVLITLKLADGDLRALADCGKLEHLALFYAPKLTDLGFLADLPQLRTLALLDIPRLDFATFPPMPSLQEFVFLGGFQKTVMVHSLSPLARLKGLRRLELSNVAAVDGSLAPLAALQGLENLCLPGTAYEVEEYAHLAASLPNTRGARMDCLNPLFSKPEYVTPGKAHHPCPRCAQPRVLLTGKGTRISCLTCDGKRIEKHIARWEAARQPFA
jgi:hypothetical protein